MNNLLSGMLFILAIIFVIASLVLVGAGFGTYAYWTLFTSIVLFIISWFLDA